MEQLTALSVLDGRYAKLVGELGDIFSEYGLIRHRVHVETCWLVFLGRDLGLFDLNGQQAEAVAGISSGFDVQGARRIKEIEKTTNHDVKAVEYYIKEQLDRAGLSAIREWTHFACTSEDINNTAYALMLRAGRQQAAETFGLVLETIESMARQYRSVPMMSRTHGQPATPTTVGKEMVNFAWRLRREQDRFLHAPVEAKFNGASGNFNAHAFVFPEIDWIDASRRFLSQSLKVEPLLFTTQINPYNYIAEILHAMIRIAAVLIDLDRDMWGYISLGYFRQKVKEGEVGSSTMPHKVNPIDFENSEGNMGVAIGMMEHLSVKLLQSRFQRDLSDSTVLRNLGAVFGYFVIGMKNCLKGLHKIDINEEQISGDLAATPELLAEPLQTVMRVFGEDNPYERLKSLTRGKKVTSGDFAGMISDLSKVPEAHKQRMKRLSCDAYTGMAERLVDAYFKTT
ncbi:adenylosuccinate lyase [Desulfosudis oleivorans]|uniref:Adenylosuccinate lyase n=1 Tax=Desulfosudis oleivorans (strain DSM 6200 / JCM 39069 / Hxd3) TaxID=96561 RepID=A8ZSC1_DESOH|nr:adenylosuccinate lyase [Desulfosudis oleivorans]ABW67658.1 adenylosuccinate lyase [Desulfosudis oleivorans Hxd3]